MHMHIQAFISFSFLHHSGKMNLIPVPLKKDIKTTFPSHYVFFLGIGEPIGCKLQICFAITFAMRVIHIM